MRVVVVGGGFGGLASAARLAKLGHDVTLLERGDYLGGALASVTADGFTWDAGPTYTLLPAVLRDLFRKSGRPLERELELVPLDIVREHRFEDGSVLALPAGSRAAQTAAVDALGAGLGAQWTAYADGFSDTWELLRRDYLERPWHPELAPRELTRLLRSREDVARRARKAFTRPAAAPRGRPSLRSPRATTRATCRPGWASRRTSSSGSAPGRCPAGWRPSGVALGQRMPRGAWTCGWASRPTDVVVRGGRAVGGRDPRRGARRRRWSCARSTRAACRRWREHVRAHDARAPARGLPPRPRRRRRPRPAPRGGAPRRPDAGGAHRRRRARRRRGVDRPRPRPARRGRPGRAGPAPGSTSAPRSSRGSTGRPRDLVERVGRLAPGRAVAGRAHGPRTGSARPRRSRACTPPARTRRPARGCRSSASRPRWWPRRSARPDRARSRETVGWHAISWTSASPGDAEARRRRRSRRARRPTSLPSRSPRRRRRRPSPPATLDDRHDLPQRRARPGRPGARPAPARRRTPPRERPPGRRPGRRPRAPRPRRQARRRPRRPARSAAHRRREVATDRSPASAGPRSRTARPALS